MSFLQRWIGLMALLLAAWPAQAHKPSDSYLSISVGADALTGRWDIALRDLDFAIGLDANGDGEITWGELRARHGEIAAYAASRLEVRADSAACTIEVGAQAVDEHTDGAYSVLPLKFGCAGAAAPTRLTLVYRLFADVDPQHRGLLNLPRAARRAPRSSGRKPPSRLSTCSARAAGRSSGNTSKKGSGTSGSASTTSCSCCRCCCRR
jgi:hypothetical protein